MVSVAELRPGGPFVMASGLHAVAASRHGAPAGRAGAGTVSVAAVNDDMIAAVVDTVRPDRPHSHGAALDGRSSCPHQEQITAWVTGDGEQNPLTIAKL